MSALHCVTVLARRRPAAACVGAVLVSWAAAGIAQGLEPAARTVDVPAAIREFELRESDAPVPSLVTSWVKPSKMVVVVDRPERVDWLAEAVPGVTIVGVVSSAEAREEIADADALVLGSCRADLFEGATRLKWIHAAGGGSEQCLELPGVRTRDILVTNSQKTKSTILAEMAMGYVYALARSIDVALENQRRRNFSAIEARPAMQLEGSTMLIVGLGGAGTEIARVAHAIGMRVIATRNSSREGPEFVDYVGLADELESLIGEADIVMIAAPLTPQTRGLFDAATFSRMRPGAMLVNWSRAEIVVAEDLAAALEDGRVGSAALNWATTAPLPPEHPLWSAPNLILAPWTGTGGGAEVNRANQSELETELRWVVVRENMRRYVAGDRMFSVFDVERGY